MDEPKSGSERRRDPRIPYRRPAWIAFYKGETPPSEDDFQLYDCNDISRSGFSFWNEGEPKEKNLVVILGDPPKHIRVQARVMRWELGEHKQKLAALVGCEFLQRMEEL